MGMHTRFSLKNSQAIFEEKISLWMLPLPLRVLWWEFMVDSECEGNVASRMVYGLNSSDMWHDPGADGSVEQDPLSRWTEEKEDMSGHFIRDLLTRELLNKACQRSSQVMRSKPSGLIISKWNSGMWAPMSQSIWKARADFQVQWGLEDGTKPSERNTKPKADQEQGSSASRGAMTGGGMLSPVCQTPSQNGQGHILHEYYTGESINLAK